MNHSEDQPVIASQTLAQNEAVENVLSRFQNKELFIPPYQRDADQWDDIKKSIFIESILHRLTIPALYLAASENNPEIFEIVDGQQRLTTLNAFYTGSFTLSKSDECPYYGNSAYYAEKSYGGLEETWQRVFRRYNLTLVSLPSNMDLSLRLEIFRRINEGGTPLSGQDIRLGYYSQSQAVRFIQTVGIFDPSREGSKRIIEEVGYSWPWVEHLQAGDQWNEWWSDSRVALGQTASEMFLWYLVSVHRTDIDRILSDRNRLAANLKQTFRGNSDEVLDIICAQFRYEDLQPDEPRLLPSMEVLKNEDFPRFTRWWHQIRLNCGSIANVSKHRSVALLIPALDKVFKFESPSRDQWTLIGRFLRATRETAKTILHRVPRAPREVEDAEGATRRVRPRCPRDLEKMNQPPYLLECDPESRTFPLDWKWAYYRMQGGILEGYHCPICQQQFFGPGRNGFSELHGDHIISWKHGGRTIWDNLQLLCGPCNRTKSSG